MERTEKIGLGVALAGHVVLFGLLSVGFLATPNPEKLKQQPVEVSLGPDVALEAAAPAASEAPSQSVAPEVGEIQDSPPPAPEQARPRPAPQPAPAPEPRPAPAPPKPQPEKAAPAKPQPKPEPAKPAPKPQPKPKPAPSAPAKPKPAPAAERKEAAAPATSSAKTPAKSAASASNSKSPPSAAKGSGEKADKPARPRGGRLGDDFLKGLTAEKSSTKNNDAAPSAARIDGRALASIVQAIARQIQPCADRQVDPGPGANAIVTKLNLKLNRDGTLAATPTVVGQTGITDENQRYARRVVDLGIAAFKGCSPLKLPAEYYATPNGGWNNINFNWKLR